MSSVGFSVQSVVWFKSYLSNRRFKTYFRTFIASAQCKQHNPQLVLHTDDLCLVYQNRDVKVFEQELNKILSNVLNCFVNSKLGIHFGKIRQKLHCLS